MNTDLPFPPRSLVAAYIRDSGGDTQELSAQQQEKVMRLWCQDHGCTLTRVFVDAASGTTTKGRDAFHQMMVYFRQGAPEAGLLIWRFNRFARNINDAQYYRADLRRRGYIVHSLKDDIPAGTYKHLFETIADTIAQKKSEELAEDVQRGLYDNLERYGTLGGIPPKGFQRETVQISTHRDGRPHLAAKWVPDPDMIPLIRKAWQMRAAGATYGQIKAATHLFGSINSFSTFFRNKLYIGILEFGDTVIADYCEPIIDLPTWEAVQARVRVHRKQAKQSKNHPRRKRSSYLLSGLIFCNQCGSPLNGHTIKSQDGHTYKYYRCSRRRRKRDCEAPAIPKPTLEAYVLQQLQEHILAPANLTQLQAQARQQTTAQRNEYQAELIALRKQKGPLERQINNLVAAIADAGHSQAMLQTLSALEDQSTSIQAQIDALVYQAASLDQPQPGPATLSQKVRVALSTATKAEKRSIICGIIDHIDVLREGRIVRGTIYYYTPTLPKKKSALPPNPDHESDHLDFYVYGSNPRGGTLDLGVVSQGAQSIDIKNL